MRQMKPDTGYKNKTGYPVQPNCQVYRLLTTGSIEEKIYQRQLKKSGLAGGLEAAGFAGGSTAANFTLQDLKDLFTFREVVQGDPLNMTVCIWYLVKSDLSSVLEQHGHVYLVGL